MGSPSPFNWFSEGEIEMAVRTTRRLNLTYTDRSGLREDYVAPRDITEELPDGSGIEVLVIPKGMRIPFKEALTKGLVDEDGNVTELGGSNALVEGDLGYEDFEADAAMRAKTVHTLPVPEHAYVTEDTPTPAMANRQMATGNHVETALSRHTETGREAVDGHLARSGARTGSAGHSTRETARQKADREARERKAAEEEKAAEAKAKAKDKEK